MIWETEISLLFPEGAVFSENPDLLLYRKILAFIRTISCVNSQTRCIDCSQKENCRYYWITGDNFQTYAGLLCHPDVRRSKIFEPGQTGLFRLIWTGKAKDFAPLCEVALNSSNQRLAGQTYVLRSVKTKLLDISAVFSADSIWVENLRIASSDENLFKTMAETYQKRYALSLTVPEAEYEFQPRLKTDLGVVRLPTARIHNHGESGYLKLLKPVKLNNSWLVLGLGKNNCIGGGRFEINHHI